MLKAGVIGAGHLGKIHLKLLDQSTKYELVGFHDADPKASEKIKSEFGYNSFSSQDELIASCDVVDVVTPTMFHFDCAKKVIEDGKHLFIEKPITHTVEEAEIIRKLAKKH